MKAAIASRLTGESGRNVLEPSASVQPVLMPAVAIQVISVLNCPPAGTSVNPVPALPAVAKLSVPMSVLVPTVVATFDAAPSVFTLPEKMVPSEPEGRVGIMLAETR
ncbi:hypothetical protein D3C73_1445140 [compost metagenome]